MNAYLPRILLFAVVTGAVGFSAGFFGPLFLAPDANQGPLLGILITGPLGILIGGLIGLADAHRRSRKH
ncbi:MAG: hypothetical protein RLZ45_2642 [Verrucomicrobiota bacterium]|jgi:hypothetical protein